MDVSIKGDKELQRTFKSLEKFLNHKDHGAINLDAAKPLIEKEKLLAPEGPTGNLVDSIGGIKVTQKKAVEIGEVHVGPRLRRPYRGQHGHLVEFGTKKRVLKGRGKYPAGTSRGLMPAKPFVKPALSQTKDLVLSRVQNSTAKRIVLKMKRELGTAFIR
jgi:HK97 gp10 family phage protein